MEIIKNVVDDKYCNSKHILEIFIFINERYYIRVSEVIACNNEFKDRAYYNFTLREGNSEQRKGCLRDYFLDTMVVDFYNTKILAKGVRLSDRRIKALALSALKRHVKNMNNLVNF